MKKQFVIHNVTLICKTEDINRDLRETVTPLVNGKITTFFSSSKLRNTTLDWVSTDEACLTKQEKAARKDL